MTTAIGLKKHKKVIHMKVQRERERVQKSYGISYSLVKFSECLFLDIFICSLDLCFGTCQFVYGSGTESKYKNAPAPDI